MLGRQAKIIQIFVCSGNKTLGDNTEMQRACKQAAACRSRRRIHATSTRPLSATPRASPEEGGAEEGDWKEVGVFWDFENCTIPSSFDPFRVRPNIERALRASGFFGPISLSGYGNIHGHRGHCLEALSETGIDLHHVPSGGQNASDRALIIDMMLWTMKHSPPAHVMLISGDSDFSVLLHKLRLLNYNILLAAPNNNGMSSALVHAASRIWVWPDIATGEGLLGHEHISGTPSPFQKDDMTRNKEASLNRPNTDLHQDMRHALEIGKDPHDDVVNGFKSPSDAGWIPLLIVKKITSIVERHPGISLGEMSKALKSMNIYPRLFGFANTNQFLMSIQQLETRFTDGLSMKERTRYYLPGTDNSTTGNALDCEESAPQKDHVSHGMATHDGPSDGAVGNEKTATKGSIHRDDKDSAKKRSSGQEKSPAASMQWPWASRLFTLFKGR